MAYRHATNWQMVYSWICLLINKVIREQLCSTATQYFFKKLCPYWKIRVFIKKNILRWGRNRCIIKALTASLYYVMDLQRVQIEEIHISRLKLYCNPLLEIGELLSCQLQVKLRCQAGRKSVWMPGKDELNFRWADKIWGNAMHLTFNWKTTTVKPETVPDIHEP